MPNALKLTIEQVEQIPPSSYRKGPRGSQAREVVEELQKSETHKLSIKAPDQKELDKFYKSLIQWRARHKDEVPLGIRKDKDVLYVWLEEEPKA